MKFAVWSVWLAALTCVWGVATGVAGRGREQDTDDGLINAIDAIFDEPSHPGTSRHKRFIIIPGVLATIQALSTLQSVCKKDESKEPESAIGAHHYPVDGRLTESIRYFTNESLELMEEDVKIMIAGTRRYLSKHMAPNSEFLIWEDVMPLFSQNLLLEKIPGSEHHVHSQWLKGDSSWWNFGIEKNGHKKVQQVLDWYNSKLVTDSEVRKEFPMNYTVIKELVAVTSTCIKSWPPAFKAYAPKIETVLNINVLRYPDIEHQYFKLYRIRLTVWSQTEKRFIVQRTMSGIDGEFDVVHFQPRKSLIARLPMEIRNKAVAQAADILISE